MLRQKADEEMIPPPRSCSAPFAKEQVGRQGRTPTGTEDTKEGGPAFARGRQGLLWGLKEKGPLPGMFMEGFQEEVVFTRSWDRKKRERDSIEWEGLEQGRKE